MERCGSQLYVAHWNQFGNARDIATQIGTAPAMVVKQNNELTKL
jgi:hypothetical protein